MAHFIRCITKHAPTGAYRLRFHGRLQEPYFCALHDRPAAVHSWKHILFGCEYYTWQFRHLSIEDLLNSFDPFYDIEQFLIDNSMAMAE